MPVVRTLSNTREIYRSIDISPAYFSSASGGSLLEAVSPRLNQKVEQIGIVFSDYRCSLIADLSPGKTAIDRGDSDRKEGGVNSAGIYAPP